MNMLKTVGLFALFNCCISVAYADALIFSKEPAIPATVELDTVHGYEFTLENTAISGSITFSKSLVPNTDPRVSISSGGTCGTSIIAQSKCSIVVNVNATSLGAINEVLTIDYSGRVKPLESSIVTTVVEPLLLSVTAPTIPSPIHLGTTATGLVFTLTNTGNSDAYGIVPSIYYDYGTIKRNGGTCSTSTFVLVPGQSCTLSYDITPTVVGFSKQQLSLHYYRDDAPRQATSDIQFYTVLAASPTHAYVANTGGFVSTCSIATSGDLTCPSTVNVPGATSIDFTKEGTSTYGYVTSNTQKIEKCLVDADYTLNCALQTYGSTSNFIKFLTPTLAYEGIIGTGVDLCSVIPSSNTFTCQNVFSNTNVLAFAMLEVNAKKNAYIAVGPNVTTEEIFKCPINTNGTFGTCIDAANGVRFNITTALDFVSAGLIYAYVPVQSNSITSELLKCPVANDGALDTCSLAKTFNSVSTIDGIKVTTVNDIPYAYVGLHHTNGTYTVEKCEISKDGNLSNCTPTGSGFNQPKGITTL